MNKETLYSLDSKGKIRVWSVWTEGAEIVMESGILNGKMKIERRTAKPKNVGNANETTGERQAEMEAESRVNKQRDKGYFDTEEEARNTVVVLPMLAHPFEKRAKYVKYPAYAQPKLDGTRCLAICHPGQEIELITRKGKPYPHLPHIRHALEPLRFLGRKIALDGEIYCHGDLPFERLAGLVRKKTLDEQDRADMLKIGYRCYDMIILDDLSTPFSARIARLRNTIEYLYSLDAVSSGCLGVVETVQVDREGVDAMHAKYVAEGYEGVMVRNADGPYGLNNRSNDLLKLKNFEDDEFEIVGFRQAEGKDEGTVIWRCKTKSGAEFDVRPRGSHEERTAWFVNGESYVGKPLTVRYQELTQDGLPRFPVGIAIRDYE